MEIEPPTAAQAAAVTAASIQALAEMYKLTTCLPPLLTACSFPPSGRRTPSAGSTMLKPNLSSPPASGLRPNTSLYPSAAVADHSSSRPFFPPQLVPLPGRYVPAGLPRRPPHSEIGISRQHPAQPTATCRSRRRLLPTASTTTTSAVLHLAFRKLGTAPPAIYTSLSPSRAPLIHLKDSATHTSYLVDTGAAISLLPFSSPLSPTGPEIVIANGSPIPSWNFVRRH
jgi:hypothetical protein